jgi:NAD-dependent dihydropyrimidine dehydrogenase PreA subunit
MIEIVSESRCTGCNICVRVCPTNVFDLVAGAAPSIARQQDCQTCFMCELYCPEDALFVAAETDKPAAVSEAAPATQALLGSYRSAVGWKREQNSTASLDASYQLLQRAH